MSRDSTVVMGRILKIACPACEYSTHVLVDAGMFAAMEPHNCANCESIVDVLIHEVVTGRSALYEQYPELINIRDHHTTPEQVGRIFAMAEPRLAVYTHLVNLSAPGIPVVGNEELIEATRETYGGPLVVGHDLLGIEIGDTIAIFDRTKPGLEL